MSVQSVTNEIKRFLNSTQPEVMSISGEWGTGKTYTWDSTLRLAQQKQKLGLKKYAYISLFGVNSLDEIKVSIFENTVESENVGLEASTETLKNNQRGLADILKQKFYPILSKAPIISDYAAAFQAASFLMVKNMIICIDDIERKGDNLSIKDVFGIASYLKEKRNCKIVFILNDQKLEKNAKEEFDNFKEKVVESSLIFSPTSREIINIAISDSKSYSDMLKEFILILDMKNVRVIKRIERILELILNELDGYHSSIIKQVIHTVTLFGFSIYSNDKENFPSFEYIKGRSSFYSGLVDKSKLTDQEKRYELILDTYNFVRIDEFDLELYAIIERGYVEVDILKSKAKAMQKTYETGDAHSAFENAWSIYHNSFDSNQSELKEQLILAYTKNLDFVTLASLNGVVTILKDLNYNFDALSLIELYRKHHENDQSVFDLSINAFEHEVNDPDLVKMVNQMFGSFKDERSPSDVLVQLANSQSWSQKEIDLLKRLKKRDFLQIFKSVKGQELSQIVRVCLMFGNTQPTNADQQHIANEAIAALRDIAKESQLNNRRVQNKYGIQPLGPDASRSKVASKAAKAKKSPRSTKPAPGRGSKV